MSLPFGLNFVSASYSLTQNGFFLSSNPVIVQLCVKEANLVAAWPSALGIQLGSAGLGFLRICAYMGIKTDNVDGSRIALVDLDTESFTGPCPRADPAPLFPTGLPPYGVEADDYQPINSGAQLTQCPAPVGTIPGELQGTGETSSTVLPFDFPLPLGFDSVTTVDGGSVLQDLLSGSAFIKLCVHNTTRYTRANTGGTVPPPGPSTSPSLAWYHVRFGDPMSGTNTSTCALMARRPSTTIPGKDDLLLTIGQPGKACPIDWNAGPTQYNVTFPGFYVSVPNGSLKTAVGWAQLSATLLLGLLGMVFFSPAPVL